MSAALPTLTGKMEPVGRGLTDAALMAYERTDGRWTWNGVIYQDLAAAERAAR